MHAAFDDLRVLLRGAVGSGCVLQPARREQNRTERIADVVADDRENPLLEVAGERELFLTVPLVTLLGSAPLVDIDAAADETREGSAIVGEWNTAIEDPAVGPVVAPQAVLHFERFTAPEVIEVIRHAAIEIVRVHALGPAFTHLLLERAAGEREPGLVEIVAVRVQAGAPDHDRRMLHEQAQAVLSSRRSSAHGLDYAASVSLPKTDSSSGDQRNQRCRPRPLRPGCRRCRSATCSRIRAIMSRTSGAHAPSAARRSSSAAIWSTRWANVPPASAWGRSGSLSSAGPAPAFDGCALSASRRCARKRSRFASVHAPGSRVRKSLRSFVLESATVPARA